MNEGGIRPAVASICMTLFICSEPAPLSAAAGEDQAALLTWVWVFSPEAAERKEYSFMLARH